MSRRLKGVLSSKKKATKDPQKLIEDYPCDEVWLSVWNVEDDDQDTRKAPDDAGRYETTNEEVYWGFNGVAVHPLFPTKTEKIPVSNGNQIFVRSNKQKGAKTTVAFSCFREINQEEIKK